MSLLIAFLAFIWAAYIFVKYIKLVAIFILALWMWHGFIQTTCENGHVDSCNVLK